MSLPNNPITRKEMYLSNIAGQTATLPSEPHTREEEYLDYIAKNGGGGGTGEGDMTKAVYDVDLAVASAGGIADYVAGAITGKVDKVQGKGLSTNDYDNTAKGIVDGVNTALDGKVSKSNTAGLLKNDGTVDTNTYAQTSALSGYIAKSNTAGLVKNDGTIDTTTTGAVAANTSAISGIKDGTNIDSFGDVETALDDKVTKLVAGGVLGTDGSPISVETPLTLSNGEIGLMFGNIEEGVQTSPPTAGDVYSALAPKANTSDVNSKFTATVDLLKDTTGWLGGNICKRFSSQAKNGGTLTVDPNTGICSLSGTTSAQTSFLVEQSLKAGTYILDGAPTSGSSIGSYDMLVVNMDESSLPTIARDYAGVTTEKKFTLTTDTNVRIMCRVPQGALDTTKKFAPMILTEEQYNFNPTYRPYHSTAEEEIQASISLLDNTTGWIGKNHFNGKATSKTAQGVTWVIDANDNNIVTVSGTPTGFEALTVDSKKVLPVGEYVLSGISDMVNVVYNGVFLYKNDVMARDLQIADDNAPRTFSILQSDDYDTIRVQLKRATNGVACSGTGKIMITTPEEYKLSPAYEPQHDSVAEMFAKVINLAFTITTANYTGDLDDLDAGIRYCTNATGHNPNNAWGYCLTIKNPTNGVQLFIGQATEGMWYRRYASNAWQAWKTVTLS